MSTAVPPPDGRNERADRTAVQPTTDPATDQPTTDQATDQPTTDPATDQTVPTRREVVAREKERFGGMKFGACFFGWLTASGVVVLLTALVAAAGAGVGLATDLDPANPDAPRAETIGFIGAIVILAIIFVAYFAGGYVAGRMARFNGARQGVGVFLWAVIIAIVVAVLGLVAGTRFNLLANVTFPRIPVNEGDLTVVGLLTAVAVAVVALVGAILGGVTGMRFHRRVDKEGLGR
jgi:MFS family permease